MEYLDKGRKSWERNHATTPLQNKKLSQSNCDLTFINGWNIHQLNAQYSLHPAIPEAGKGQMMKRKLDKNFNSNKKTRRKLSKKGITIKDWFKLLKHKKLLQDTYNWQKNLSNEHVSIIEVGYLCNIQRCLFLYILEVRHFSWLNIARKRIILGKTSLYKWSLVKRWRHIILKLFIIIIKINISINDFYNIIIN